MCIYAHDNAPIWRPLWGAISVPHPPIWGGGYGCAYPPIWGGVCALCTPFLPPFCHHSAPCNCAQAAPDGLPISTRRVHPTRAKAPQRRPQWLTQPAPKHPSGDPNSRPNPRPNPTLYASRLHPYRRTPAPKRHDSPKSPAEATQSPCKSPPAAPPYARAKPALCARYARAGADPRRWHDLTQPHRH